MYYIMGCWDIFCFLCGNTCHSSNITFEMFLEDVEYYENNKKNKSFQLYFKPFYELYQKDKKIFEKKIKLMNINTKWLNNCTFLCANNDIIHGCKEITCNISFKDKKGNFYINKTKYDALGIYGVFTHTDCWKFIKNKYNLKLNYSYLPINIHDITQYKIFNHINYGIIEKYWSQYQNFIKMILDNNEELSYSPLKSLLVAKNIKKIFSKLKIKNDVKRIGPVISATFYDPLIYKVGINGNIWQVKSNKWIELKDSVNIKFTSPNNNFIKKIVFIGDYNNEPFFVLNIKQNKKMFDYQIISTSDFLLVKYPKLVQ